LNHGLAKLLDRTLVVGADHIQVMNTSSAQRVGLDILVLQQNLRNIAVTAGPVQKVEGSPAAANHGQHIPDESRGGGSSKGGACGPRSERVS
jgi:hypothetical protein